MTEKEMTIRVVETTTILNDDILAPNSTIKSHKFEQYIDGYWQEIPVLHKTVKVLR